MSIEGLQADEAIAWEQVRQNIEKLLWKYYDPKITPNMEELSEEIIRLVREK